MNARAAICACLLALLIGAGAARAFDDQPRKYLRFHFDGADYFGVLVSDTIFELDGDFLDGAQETGRSIPLEAVQLLPPVVPSKVIGLAFNYAAREGFTASDPPALFAKLPSAVIPHGAEIIIADAAHEPHFEGEMVIVIGTRAREVSRDEALGHVFGVTIGNDVTAHGLPQTPFHVLRAKSMDTYAPLGPWIVPGLDYDNLTLTTHVNGERVQHRSTRRMVHGVAEIVAAISAEMTLEPGDVIYTGTPGGSAALQPGDVVEITLEGVGTLRNSVADAQK